MQNPKHSIHLESEYLVHGIELGSHTIHRIRLAYGGRPDAPHEIILDPNTCTLDGFGDATACTRVALHAVDITLTQLMADDTRRLYRIDGEGLASPSLRLVLADHEHEDARLLVVGKQDAIHHVIPLHPHEA